MKSMSPIRSNPDMPTNHAAADDPAAGTVGAAVVV